MAKLDSTTVYGNLSVNQTANVVGNLNVGSGAAASPAANGSIVATGDITAFYSSDERIKTGIIEIPDATIKLCSLRAAEYYKDKGDDEKVFEVGLIAQDVEKIYPHLVSENDQGVKRIQFGGNEIIALTIASVKEQQERIDSLQAQIDELSKPWYVKVFKFFVKS